MKHFWRLNILNVFGYVNTVNVILDPIDFRCMYKALQNILICIPQNKKKCIEKTYMIVYIYIICITYPTFLIVALPQSYVLLYDTGPVYSK